LAREPSSFKVKLKKKKMRLFVAPSVGHDSRCLKTNLFLNIFVTILFFQVERREKNFIPKGPSTRIRVRFCVQMAIRLRLQFAYKGFRSSIIRWTSMGLHQRQCRDGGTQYLKITKRKRFRDRRATFTSVYVVGW
jgi:hypothetical protein